jgi:hypothetical protein
MVEQKYIFALFENNETEELHQHIPKKPSQNVLKKRAPVRMTFKLA